LVKDQWFPATGNVPIVVLVSLNCLLSQTAQSQSTVAIAIAKTKNQELLWVAVAETLVKDQWFPATGNAEIVAPQSLNYLLSQTAQSQSTVVIVIAIANQLDQVDINNKTKPFSKGLVFYLQKNRLNSDQTYNTTLTSSCL
jgi:hypothetical protein